jgi:thioredoxin-like negative regulator of GroEL
VIAIGVAWCGWRFWTVRQYKGAMARIEQAMQSGLFAAAARDLSALLVSRPRWDEVAYRLGLCEKARGRFKEADAAWALIAPDSPMNGRAVMARMDLLLEQGKLAEAEELIDKAALARGPDGWALRMLLIPTLLQEGRTEEAERIIESRWRNLNARGEGATEQAINLARLAIEVRSNPPPVDAVRAYLEQVGQRDREDDRVWLGRANLALRVGAIDEAKPWIDRCVKRRGEDPAVWRARLAWALATNQVSEVEAALTHIPADQASPAEIARLSAWLAAARGDSKAERQELETLVILEPADFAARERMLKLNQAAETSGAPLPSVDRAEVERSQARYRELFARNQPARDAAEMARLAEQLGHRFEAIAFLTAALGEEPGRVDLRTSLKRLEQENAPSSRSGGTVFDVIEKNRAPDRPVTKAESRASS